MIHARSAVAVVAAVSLTATGCGVSLNSLPLPAPRVSGETYTITAEFANALNLPSNAHVRLAGADVGQVDSMSVSNYTAVVQMTIKSDVELPVGTTAELRSATPLGDVFVALSPPDSPSGELLHDGAKIPLAETAAGATVEEILGAAALLVNGGLVRNVTKVLNGLGAAVGGNGSELAGLITETTDLISTLAARSGALSDALAQTAELTGTLAAQNQAIGDVVAAAGPALSVVSENTGRILDMVATVDTIADRLAQFPSIQGVDTRGMIADLNTIAAAFAQVGSDPNTSLDAVNQILGPAIKIMNGPAVHASLEISRILLGAVPDINFPGDPGLRPPGVEDFTNFVGSLSYQLMRLRDRIIGPPECGVIGATPDSLRPSPVPRCDGPGPEIPR